jgi:hypothetical protein
MCRPVQHAEYLLKLFTGVSSVQFSKRIEATVNMRYIVPVKAYRTDSVKLLTAPDKVLYSFR